MNFCCPSSSRLSDCLWSFFFNAPVPSGCTFTIVLSRDTASILTLTICSFCNFSNTQPNTPFFDHRLIRVYIVCQLPNRFGRPLHLHPCSATYRKALSICRLEYFTLPRWRGIQLLTFSYCSFVISMISLYHKFAFVLTRPNFIVLI